MAPLSKIKSRPIISGLTRQYSWSVRQVRAREEQERLLNDAHDEEDHADSDGLYPPNCCWTSDNPDPPNPHKDLPVYRTIHRIRRDIVDSIDDPYTLEQLKAPRMNMSVVRPLVDLYYDLQDVSIVYCLLVNRTQFLREQHFATHHQSVNMTRALLCEIVAEKVLRRFNENNAGPKGLLLLGNILVSGFEPFQNAPESIIKDNIHAMHWAIQKKAGRSENKLTALEVAIVCQSKSFLASSACRKVVDAIYRGKLVYTPSSFIDIIPDHWKRRPISLYDPRRAPILNQYRLIVPRTRNVIELCQFVILLVLYIIVMVKRESRNTVKYTNWELVFDIYGAGWVLDQFAAVLEHGWQVYSQNLWSFLDVGFSAIFCLYLTFRLHAHGLSDPDQSMLWARTSLDLLSVGAPILVPRLAFNMMSENMLFVSLRAMMSDFLSLTMLAVWSFGGFLLSLKWLHSGAHESITIAKYMIWIWFGLDGTGIQKSPDFHWFLGPVMMVTFAFLGNTLFLTILVSMLSNTFSQIAANVVPEIQYRRAVLTFEGVKSDAIFNFMPPFNIAALILMLPLKLATTPRMFHKINVYTVRVINAPLLLLIGIYERNTLWMADHHRRPRPRIPESKRKFSIAHWWSRFLMFWEFSRFSVHGDIQAVFDSEPPQELLDSLDHENENVGPKELGKHVAAGLKSQFEAQQETIHAISGKAGQNDANSKVAREGGGSKDVNDDRQDPHDAMSSSPQAVMPRKPSKAKPWKKVRTEDITSESLRKEFASSGDESQDSEANSKKRKSMKRGERMDSIIDYSADSGIAMQEANTRLHKLEDGMRRIESLLLQMADMGSDDGVDAEDELENERRSGIIK